MKRIYVSPNGSDQHAGTKEAPLKSIQAAVDMAAKNEKGYWSGPIEILLEGGVHPVEKPVCVTGDLQLTIASVPGERAIVSGGRVIENIAEGEWNGMRLWTAELPQVKNGKWYFKSLFAGGKRCARAFLPRDGFYWIESVPGHTLASGLFEGGDRFIAREGDVKNFKNLTDAEIHMFHFWIDEHLPVKSFDPETREVVSTHHSIFAMKDDYEPRFAKYRVENIIEGLCRPGDWYLDRSEGRLYYLPEEGEEIGKTQLIAPVCEQLIVAKNVTGLTVDRLDFAYTDWSIHQDIGKTFPGTRTDILYASSPQANSNVPGVLTFSHAARCAVTRCSIRHAGLYGIDLTYACRSMCIQGNVMEDLGAGGIKLNGATADQPKAERTQYVTIADNDIGMGGRVFLSGIGVASLHASHIRIIHNHIHDMYYSGVSCGWLWGYDESASFDNIIEYNHIHGLGHGILSDMGGIYTLSVQPGTRIRYNLIHDIEKANYGGWAIYPDEGSSHILIENNVCYDTSSSCFHQHYGRENIVRNNIWAFGREGMVACTRLEEHCGFSFERNIVLTDGQPIHTGAGCGNIRSDMNLYWDIGGREVNTSEYFSEKSTWRPIETLREKGYDLHSRIADPGFKDAAARDFSLLPGSPALEIGFVPIDLSGVGVREEKDWD